MNLELTHLDLFSGIGGFSLGFENAGFRTVAFCETDPDASLVLAHHWPGDQLPRQIFKAASTAPIGGAQAVTGIPVLVHGLPARLVEAAVRCAGNSVVPEIAQVIAETLRAMS